MVKEFNLSEKRQECVDTWRYREEDVKEFIKRLKEEFDYETYYPFEKLEKAIDKLAGDKLI